MYSTSVKPKSSKSAPRAVASKASPRAALGFRTEYTPKATPSHPLGVASSSSEASFSPSSTVCAKTDAISGGIIWKIGEKDVN